MKHLNDVLQESILDDADKIAADADIAIIEDWLIKHDAVKFDIDPKTHAINSSYLNIYADEPIPSYIKFGNVRAFRFSWEGKAKDVVLRLPETCQKMTIDASDCYSIEMVGEIDAPEVRLYGDFKKLILPKKVSTYKLDLSPCKELEEVDGLDRVKAEILNLPYKFCGSIIRDTLKVKIKDLAVCGNSLT